MVSGVLCEDGDVFRVYYTANRESIAEMETAAVLEVERHAAAEIVGSQSLGYELFLGTFQMFRQFVRPSLDKSSSMLTAHSSPPVAPRSHRLRGLIY
jgi:hypothetical protein